MNIKTEKEILVMRENKLDNELVIRIMTAFMLGPLLVGAIIYSTILLQVILMLVGGAMLIEWYNMTKTNSKILFVGLVFIPISVASLLSLTLITDEYSYSFLTYFAIIWGMDIFAMFGGKYFGGPKLVPHISPGKTYSGLVTGILGSIALPLLISLLPEYEFVYSGFSFVIFAFVIGLLGQAGDLFISLFKRKFNLKDTGRILPGHGGILDRFDSIIFTAPIFLYVLL